MQLDPETVQWREMFATQIAAEFERNREILTEIRALIEKHNSRLRSTEMALAEKAEKVDVQTNAVAIARLQTWVTLVGVLGGILGGLGALVSSILWLVK